MRLSGRTMLARGWESQLDRARNPLFFGGDRLEARSYRRWLDDNAVSFVVVADVPLESSGRREARLIAAGLPYLRPVWRNRTWTVLRVARPTPLTSGRTSKARLTHNTLRFTAVEAGTVRARVQWTPRWTVLSGRACVGGAPGGRVLVTVARPGRVVLAVRLGSGTPCR